MGTPSVSYNQPAVDPAARLHCVAPTDMDRERTSGVALEPSTLNSSIKRGCATPVVNAVPTEPLPNRSTATLAGSNEGEGVVVLDGLAVGTGVVEAVEVVVATGVRVAEADEVEVTVSAAEEVGVTVSAGEAVSAGVLVALAVAVCAGVPVSEADVPNDLVGVDVTAGVAVVELLGVVVTAGVPVGVSVRVLVTAGVPVGEPVVAGVPVCVSVLAGVPVCEPVDAGVTVDAGVPEHDGHAAATLYGAVVTPRNTVLVGAVASTAAALVTVLYEYSLVDEVAYSINTPHAPSCRPAMEMIMAPDCSSMAAVGACRDQVAPEYTYLAMLLVVRADVSVAQMIAAVANTNPNGLVVVPNTSVPEGIVVVGRPVNWTMPAPCVPEFVPSVQYRVDEVATREPTHDVPAVPVPAHTQPGEG